jgi:hypothetical protein
MHMTQQSPIPKYMMRDSRWGHRVSGHDEAARETDVRDRVFVERYTELAERHNLHVEVGQLSWEGPPFFAVIMPRYVYRDLTKSQVNGTAAELCWGALTRLPGYADGQLSRREALAQAQINYDAAQTPAPTLPK